MNNEILIQITDSKMPEMATSGSAGYDLYASQKVLIKAGEFEKVPTGIKIAMP
ncbi:MAG: hypothetical protein J6Z11_04940, partial [Candidatus Riflebacteria bacterium]|nr:hypothetical protein [Candidatus Riflebacteria bacterium]